LSPAAEVSLLVVRELRRSVRSAKGIVLGVLTLAGAFIVSYLAVAVEGAKRQALGALSNEAFHEMKRQGLEKATGSAKTAEYFAGAPDALLVFLEVTVWLSPLLVALLSFDSVASELQHRSVRFWAIRTRRGSYFAGKLLGNWALVALITLVLNAIANGFVVARGYATLGEVLAWGSRIWLVAVIIAGAWAAIATFVSSLFRSPILALLTTFASFFVMWLFGVVGFVERIREGGAEGMAKEMSWYEYLYPNSYDHMLLSPELPKALTGLAVLLGFVAVVTACGSLLFARRDL
jgi:ABC-type transport system involved in multi-copper enzyme maturation permease subunit